MTPPRRQRGSGRSKVMAKDAGMCARLVCYTHQQTTVFEGAPMVAGPAAVLLGDVDNDLKAEVEVAVGGVDGTLAVFKAGHPKAGPYLAASGTAAAHTFLDEACCWQWRTTAFVFFHSSTQTLSHVRRSSSRTAAVLYDSSSSS